MFIKKSKVFCIFCIFCIFIFILSVKVKATTEEPDYRYWNQSNYSGLGYQCYVVAEAKLLYAANIQRHPDFNPLSWFWWKNGYGSYAGGPPSLMENYAASVGKQLTYGGTCNSSNVWEKINAGYYVILHLTSQSGGVHYAFVDNEYSRANGEIWIDESGANYSNKPYGGNGPRALSDCPYNIILNDSVWYYVPTIKPNIPSTVLNLGDDFYSYILMSNNVGLFNVDVNSQVILQNGVWQDTKQAWNFIRQSNGAYRIKNQSTNRFLAMPLSANYDGGTITTVENAYDDNYCYDFYLYGSQEQCVIKPAVCQTRTVSIDGGVNIVGAKLNMWDYWAVETQLFNIWKIDDVAIPATLDYSLNGQHVTLKWSNTSNNYNIVIQRKAFRAGWISFYKEIQNVSTNSYEIDLPDGYYYIITITNSNWCNTAHSNQVAFLIEENKNPIWHNSFNDVKEKDWFYGAVKYVAYRNYIKGYNTNTFAPNDKLTRGMLVTILHRIEERLDVPNTSKFPDVQDKQAYYYSAVKWAAAYSIVRGYDNGKFGPNDPITREQLAVILNNYCKYRGKYKATKADYSKYKDANKISEFAKWGMNWAVGSGVITGNEKTNTLDPQGTATRAEVASMIYKYCLNF